MNSIHDPIHVPIIVVGGGQAGLAVGHELSRSDVRFLILDANDRIGDSWRNRYDSLRLFSPAFYDGLPGMRFPGRPDRFPTKDELADYLEAYAKRFRLPVRSGVRVEELTREGGSFVLRTNERTYVCDSVIVAMAGYQSPRVPEFAARLDPAVVQLHSSAYRNPAQLKPGGVLVVGAGNSAADIALEVSRTHPTWMSGKEVGAIPVAIESAFARLGFVHLIRFIGHHVMTLDTPMGRRLRPRLLHSAQPLIRVRPRDLERAGVKRVPRVTGAREGKTLLADGRTLEVANVIWATGYGHGFSWIRLPIFDEQGDPRHTRGVVSEIPGLYFVGLQFLYAMSSATLTGVGRDAARVVRAVEQRERALIRRSPPRAAASEVAA
jgi:putative flavoprotein involved in K+ transport